MTITRINRDEDKIKKLSAALMEFDATVEMYFAKLSDAAQR